MVVILTHHVFKKCVLRKREIIKRIKKANKINNLYAEPPDARPRIFFEKFFLFQKKMRNISATHLSFVNFLVPLAVL